MTPGPKKVLAESIKKLLDTPKALLTSLQRQRAFLGAQALRTPPCPYCDKPVSQLDAAADTFKLEGLYADTDYTCPHCGKALRYVLPFFGGGWHWWTDLSR